MPDTAKKQEAQWIKPQFKAGEVLRSNDPRLQSMEKPTRDMVNSPDHYTWHPSGVECIAIAEAFNLNVGAALQYLWRHEHKGNPIEDLEKARWHIDREIARRRKSET